MYEIRPETVKAFIQDNNIRLPRFQRKQTWNEKKNFELCVSLFKEYPIGVCILSIDNDSGRKVRWLLDGRQRKNALSLIYEDPENIYNWGKKFINFFNGDQPYVVEDKFWEKINEYLEEDIDDNEENINTPLILEDEIDTTEPIETDIQAADLTKDNMTLLLEIIKIFHNKYARGTGFTKPFDFIKYIEKLPFVEMVKGQEKLSCKKLKLFLDEYKNRLRIEGLYEESVDSFYDYIDSRGNITDEVKLRQHIQKNWEAMRDRIMILEKIDNLLATSKIGIIEAHDLSPSDSQKIFNIINTKGEKLTAVEVLSAKPRWNLPIINPSSELKAHVSNLYKRIGVSPNTTNIDIVKWDLPATLIKQVGKNFALKDFKDTKADFERELTLGFKILSGIYVNGVKKEDVENLSKSENINWNSDFEAFARDLKQMMSIVMSFDYFKFLNSWNTNIMELTSDSIALNFIILVFKDWERKGKPIGTDIKTRQLQKNAFILLDKLIFEYVNNQWRGSSDSKIAANISAFSQEGDTFSPVNISKWEGMLNEIFENSSIDGNDITLTSMKPILYHYYCIKGIDGPGQNYEIEVDHIIPQSLFRGSTFDRKDVIANNILNLGLLPKSENASKGKRRLIELTNSDSWLKTQISKYEFIEESEYAFYSDINNYIEVYKQREALFLAAFGGRRNSIINN